jgi:hypothetical protein
MKCPSGAPCLTFGISSRRDFEELDSSDAPSCFLGLVFHARSSDTLGEPNVTDRAKVFTEILEETQPHGIVVRESCPLVESWVP